MKHVQIWLGKLFLSSTLLLSGLSLAQSEPENCVNINQRQALIEQYIEQAPYRQAREGGSAHFSYQLQQSYPQYLDYARQVIAERNPRANMQCPLSTTTYRWLAKQQQWQGKANVQQLLAPFQLTHPNKQKLVLLIHGLTDSPFHFHDLAWQFYQQGFDVRTLLLPGHATAPSDLLKVTYQQWQQAADYAIERSLKDYSQVYLGGFSTGGALILSHLLANPQHAAQVQGVMLWSPASKAHSGLAWLAKYVSWFSRWLDKEGDVDFAKYESFAYNAGAQVNDLMNHLNKQFRNSKHLPNVPLLVVASEQDQTIDTRATLAILEQWHQPAKRSATAQDMLIYYGDPASIPATLAKDLSISTPRCATASCEAIQGIAHTATINAPSNAHYGENGDYRNCSHYLKNLKRYAQCKQDSDVVKGEISEQNLSRNPKLQRLSYNPYFQQMLGSIQQFIAATEQ
ncbi:alpha/beta hydrolase [Agarivorans sp. QJM3NY_33]|uniref:alpha/beta hydrolase n=1 Tax=Agarivorans sp. QJM3NY_33 TaxID=3421432 RepID=UPI003D7D3EE1